jgi:hypothetical protein
MDAIVFNIAVYSSPSSGRISIMPASAYSKEYRNLHDRCYQGDPVPVTAGCKRLLLCFLCYGLHRYVGKTAAFDKGAGINQARCAVGCLESNFYRAVKRNRYEEDDYDALQFRLCLPERRHFSSSRAPAIPCSCISPFTDSKSMSCRIPISSQRAGSSDTEPATAFMMAPVARQCLKRTSPWTYW